MRVSMSPESRRRYVFVWPAKGDIPEPERIRVVCQIPSRSDRLRLAQASFEEVTDERSQTTRRQFNLERHNELLHSSIISIDNVVNAESGEPLNGADCKNKIEWLISQNFGLDEDTYGVFEIEFFEWHSRWIMRNRDEEAKKNLSSSSSPATATGAAQTPKSPASTAKAS